MKNRYIELGKIIREKREENKLTLGELSALIGISRSELFKIEDGQRKHIRLNLIVKICEILCINFDTLLKFLGYYDNDNVKDYDILVNEVIQKTIRVKSTNIDDAIEKALNFSVGSCEGELLSKTEFFDYSIPNKKQILGKEFDNDCFDILGHTGCDCCDNYDEYNNECLL